MGDVTKRRGRVLGMNPDEDGLQVVEAEVPVAEMQDFTTFLRPVSDSIFICLMIPAPSPATQDRIVESGIPAARSVPKYCKSRCS